MRRIIKIVEAIRKCAGSAGSRRSPPTPSSALTSHRIRKEALVAGTEGAKHSTNHSFANRRRGLDDVDPACEIADVLRRFGLFRHANSPRR